MTVLRALGLMSGTSLDAIDAALIRTDGEGVVEPEAFLSIPYDSAMRARIRACFGMAERTVESQKVEEELTRLHAAAVRQLLAAAGVAASAVDVIGFHGQTISHAPERRHTLQLGDGALLSRLTGIQVVNDFRSADVASGGQGAPLVPVYHRALAHKICADDLPVVFLNIGGVANITFVGTDDILIACDTGPGNALIDDWMLARTGAACDVDGATALKGRCNRAILDHLMAHPFFTQHAPKSLDRNAFSSALCEGLSLEDGAATLTAFTAASIAAVVPLLPQTPHMWIVAGGGRLNAALMRQLRERLPGVVKAIDDIGLDGDAIEAQAFAYLAVRSLKALPLSFPATTGVSAPLTGGTRHAAA